LEALKVIMLGGIENYLVFLVLPMLGNLTFVRVLKNSFFIWLFEIIVFFLIKIRCLISACVFFVNADSVCCS